MTPPPVQRSPEPCSLSCPCVCHGLRRVPIARTNECPCPCHAAKGNIAQIDDLHQFELSVPDPVARLAHLLEGIGLHLREMASELEAYRDPATATMHPSVSYHDSQHDDCEDETFHSHAPPRPQER